MLKTEGWTRDEIKDLGIQYSDKAIDVYLNLDAEDALAKVGSKYVAVALENGSIPCLLAAG